MPNEPFLERNRQLERSVRRWRLVSLCLALLLMLVLVVGGILTAIPRTQEPGDFWHWLPWVRARAAREAKERDFLEEAIARQVLEDQIRAAKEREKRAQDAAP